MNRNRLILRIGLMALSGPVILFLSAADLGWAMGWVFAAFTFGFTLFSRLQILHKSPGLLAERAASLKKDYAESTKSRILPGLW